MRLIFFILTALLTCLLVFILNRSWRSIPALGRFVSPQHGFWKNAERADLDPTERFNLEGLDGPSTVYFDERLVPHVIAGTESDVYFIQGYLHARFRLWQMEMQTFAAAGRTSEVVGVRALKFDKQQRRMGMVFAAQNMLLEAEKDPITKKAFDRYTAGVNFYIDNLSARELPLEYKLLGYRPEKWNNLKVALFVKQMAKTLASNEDDLALSYAKNYFNDAQLKILFPQTADSLEPIIPPNTIFAPASITPSKPSDIDSAYINNNHIIPLKEIDKPNPANGSNNWTVSGSRTKSGKPILANDPHLDLTLPSVWFEMQLSTPGANVYGASFPGCPGIIVGFNDYIAWGVTNAGRDVRDYFEIQFKDSTKSHYWFDNAWKKVDSLHIEAFHVKGSKVIYDTVAYIDQGPVMFDEDFEAGVSPGRAYAVRWTAHDPSNEMLAIRMLNYARNYQDYLNAIRHFLTPAQNFAFASVDGDIAIWQQGRFPARWDQQGVYVLPYVDKRYTWQGYIPQEENPHILNPARGYVSSANQQSVTPDYPYFIPGNFDLYRGIRINRKLAGMEAVTPQDMMNLQNDNFNSFAATAVPLFLKHLDTADLNEVEKRFFDSIATWNYYNEAELIVPTLFKLWYDSLETFVWNDQLKPLNDIGLRPKEETLVEALLRDSNFTYIDNVNTPNRETISDAITAAFRVAVVRLSTLKEKKGQTWGAYKNTTVYHLLGRAMLPFARTGLPVGGGTHVVNAMQHSHGPSWKMVVEMTTPKQAWVIYPGGQSGNPGSKYYDNFINDYAAGKYYKAWIMQAADKDDPRILSRYFFEHK
ncbi:penicillin acylase family protein [Flavitalea antarctica]